MFVSKWRNCQTIALLWLLLTHNMFGLMGWLTSSVWDVGMKCSVWRGDWDVLSRDMSTMSDTQPGCHKAKLNIIYSTIFNDIQPLMTRRYLDCINTVAALSSANPSYFLLEAVQISIAWSLKCSNVYACTVYTCLRTYDDTAIDWYIVFFT